MGQGIELSLEILCRDGLKGAVDDGIGCGGLCPERCCRRDKDAEERDEPNEASQRKTSVQE
jgi:hypothetical protein